MFEWLKRLFGATSRPAPAPAWLARELAIVEAMGRLASWVTPFAPPEVLEVAARIAFKDVPGFDAAYKDCVCVDGRWRDLVHGHQTPEAQWNPDAFGQSYPTLR
jgi:hypothetical protein